MHTKLKLHKIDLFSQLNFEVWCGCVVDEKLSKVASWKGYKPDTYYHDSKKFSKMIKIVGHGSSPIFKCQFSSLKPSSSMQFVLHLCSCCPPFCKAFSTETATLEIISEFIIKPESLFQSICGAANLML